MDNLIPHYSKKFRSILIFGPPGSGKGTMGRFLSAAGNHVHLSSGDIFRGLSPDSPAGQLFHSYASKGHLVPDNVTLKIWHNYVLGLIATNKYFPTQQFLLLDGIPRTLEQAKLLDEYIDPKGVIVLKIDNKQKLVERMKRRALIEGRHDDADEKVLMTRFKVYEETTHALLDHYPHDKIVMINADQKPLDVLKDILTKTSGILSHPEIS
jgi:adenylate kinase